jgi:hypothetical protein
MRLWFACLLLVALNFGTWFCLANNEASVQRWQRRVATADAVIAWNEEIAFANEYAQNCYEAVRMLATENGLLCEREAATVKTIAAFEEESLKLKSSLDDAVDRLQKQEKTINDLIEENENLTWKIEVLESNKKASIGLNTRAAGAAVTLLHFLF